MSSILEFLFPQVTVSNSYEVKSGDPLPQELLDGVLKNPIKRYFNPFEPEKPTLSPFTPIVGEKVGNKIVDTTKAVENVV